MDRLAQRLEIAARAVATLREVVPRATARLVERDAAIKRFEYSVEATWKAAQQYLRTVEGREVGSPKAAIRAAREAGLLSDTDAARALAMADDRNLAAHTYNEDLAKALAARLPGHLALLEAWLGAMTQRAPPVRPGG